MSWRARSPALCTKQSRSPFRTRCPVGGNGLSPAVRQLGRLPNEKTFDHTAPYQNLLSSGFSARSPAVRSGEAARLPGIESPGQRQATPSYVVTGSELLQGTEYLDSTPRLAQDLGSENW